MHDILKNNENNQVIYSYFETKSNPFSIFNKNIDEKILCIQKVP